MQIQIIFKKKIQKCQKLNLFLLKTFFYYIKNLSEGDINDVLVDPPPVLLLLISLNFCLLSVY